MKALRPFFVGTLMALAWLYGFFYLMHIYELFIAGYESILGPWWAFPSFATLTVFWSLLCFVIWGLFKD